MWRFETFSQGYHMNVSECNVMVLVKPIQALLSEMTINLSA